jgi:F-type H+/Na+-transporting ATPase subunit alpha
MSDVADRLSRRLDAAGPRLDLGAGLEVRGVVTRVADDVAWVAGLDAVGCEDLVAFDSGALGMALELGPGTTGVVLLSDADRVRTGQGAAGLNRRPALAAGPEALGRVLGPLGAPLDGGPPLSSATRALFQPALEFIERKDVDQPLLTGIMVVDAAIPIGRGQRELVIGDRNVGKTSLALDMVAAQHVGDVACVYVLIGQPMSRVLAVHEALERAGAADNSVIVAADASMTAGMQYLAPYAGATMAEVFRDLGRDALVVYDDLTKHADAYRELALLLDRPPGREAFPGDIFYIHAELLERASARRPDLGGGSVTAIPIIETTDSDMSAYIPTNLISITDGQIYLDPARHERNERPAVDVGRSVSRIGGKAQPEVMRAAARNLRILISRFEELEALTRVGIEVDASTERTVHRGRILRELLRQPRFSARSISRQVLPLLAVGGGWLDPIEPARVEAVVAHAVDLVHAANASIMDALDAGRIPDGDWEAALKASVGRAVEEPRS